MSLERPEGHSWPDPCHFFNFISSLIPLALHWPEADLPRARKETAGDVFVFDAESGYRDNQAFLWRDTLHGFSEGKPLGPRSTGCPNSLLEADSIRNNNWFPGVSGMQGCEWASASFVQMERGFLRDINFTLFLCQLCSCLGLEVGGIYCCREDALP